ILSQDQTLHCKSIVHLSLRIAFCSVQDAVQFIDSIFYTYIYISIDDSILTCTTCIVYQYFKELALRFQKRVQR
ncbi:hypothetical protein, partial [Bacteroides zhangwenhongii]|uniref:hypothetical protein n=1 Tax=Bacteroides zhangwenhongii TaxID=2650157 RepID=UPI003742F614